MEEKNTEEKNTEEKNAEGENAEEEKTEGNVPYWSTLCDNQLILWVGVVER